MDSVWFLGGFFFGFITLFFFIIWWLNKHVVKTFKNWWK